MKITMHMNDLAVIGELGQRIAALRIDRNLTQTALAQEAGIARRTLERFETGQGNIQLAGFLRICRVLGLLERLNALIPEHVPGPMAQLKHKGRVRRRATGSRAVKPIRPWTWGDET
jgi:transcriptional regulator with XRE-family HTH domain